MKIVGGGGAEGTTVYLRHPSFTYFHYNIISTIHRSLNL